MLNARDVTWIRSEERGQDTDFEGRQEWSQLGFRIQVLYRDSGPSTTESPARKTSSSCRVSACS